MPGTSLQSDALRSAFGGGVCLRRPPSTVAMSRSRPLRTAAFVGLRSTHTFTVTPAFDFRSLRRGKRARFVTRATFERFTEKAIKAVMLAQEGTRRLDHDKVGAEQVLLGLIGEGTGIAAKALKSAGINLKDARVEVEKIIGRGKGFTGVELPFTLCAKRALEHSWDEARQLGHNHIGTEHLILGLLREAEVVTARVLQSFQSDPVSSRQEVIRMFGETKEVGGAGVAGGSSGKKKMPRLRSMGLI